MELHLTSFINDLETAALRLKYLPSHDALFLLSKALAMPRLLYTLRTSPSFGSKLLAKYDDKLREVLSRVTNIDYSGTACWTQTTLPIRWGGLGVRCAEFLAPSAFLASAAGAAEFMSKLIPKSMSEAQAPYVSQALHKWKELTSNTGDIELSCQVQRRWDEEMSRIIYEKLLTEDGSATTQARLKAAAAKSSGDWLKAVPVASLGLKLDDRSVMVAVGLRLGAAIVAAHVCECGKPVEPNGLHGLSCRKSSGRMMRHQELNDQVLRAIKLAGFPASREPVGLDRGDGKRPDGITLIPWANGKCLAWDVTCPDTFAASHVGTSATEAGQAAKQAEILKCRKYEALARTFTFVPVAIETGGSVGPSASLLISQLGKKIKEKTGDPRESAYLRQRLSVAIQRGNAASVLGTFSPDGEDT